MKVHLLVAVITLSVINFFCQPLLAQSSTPPVSSREIDSAYSNTIETRTAKIMTALALTDSDKSNRVHQIIVSHYYALRARDEAVNDELNDLPKGSSEWRSQRNTMVLAMSQPLHDRFVAQLSAQLTPEQIDTVKDQLTYGKVQFTYNAYCSIVPALTDDEKAKIMDLLKQAREVAIEGGNAGEKSDIFQQYKDQINSYLKTNGIDMDQATREWVAKQAAQKSSGQTNASAATQAN